jgi:hypothetical protein
MLKFFTYFVRTIFIPENVKYKAQLLVVLIFLCEAASAQILIGPTAGPQISWVSFGDRDYKDTLKVKPHVGFHAGFNLSFRVRKRFFLHTSFIYSTKGATIEGKLDPFLKDKFKYNFIEIPILYTYEIKMHVGPNKEFKWYLGAGPNLSYWLGGKGTLSSSSLNEKYINEMPYDVVFAPKQGGEEDLFVNEPNRIQLGLNLSGGFVFEPMGYQKIMLTIRYEMGHSFLSDEMGIFYLDDEYYSVLRARNNGVRISLSYLVDLKTETRKKGKTTLKKKKLR